MTSKGEVFVERVGQIIFNFQNWINVANRYIPDGYTFGNIHKLTKKDAINNLNETLNELRRLCRDLDPEYYKMLDSIK
jgi:signal transduction histidine kinase